MGLSRLLQRCTSGSLLGVLLYESRNHRLPELEGTHKDYRVQPLALHGITQTLCLRAFSNSSLNSGSSGPCPLPCAASSRAPCEVGYCFLLVPPISKRHLCSTFHKQLFCPTLQEVRTDVCVVIYMLQLAWKEYKGGWLCLVEVISTRIKFIPFPG